MRGLPSGLVWRRPVAASARGPACVFSNPEVCHVAGTSSSTRPPPAARSLLTYPPSRRRLHHSPPPFPVIETCPSPSCGCAAMPALPEGFAIDHAGKLNGAVAGYAEHVLVCTGRDDWPSRIEDEDGGDNLAADLKELFGRGGVYSDPYHHISVLNSSFPPSPLPSSASLPLPPSLQTTSAYLLPSFTYVPLLPRASFDAVHALAKGYLLPDRLHPAHDALSPLHRDRLRRPADRGVVGTYRGMLWGARPVEDVVVLVCGHGGRDVRCGRVGPVLRAEFETALARRGVRALQGPVEVDTDGGAGSGKKLPGPGAEDAGEEQEARGTNDGGGLQPTSTSTARVGLISHIGGHKFAGNVIIYVPPGATTAGGEPHPLAGCGTWYGRVEPRHVEGIVEATVLQGRVIRELFRGAIGRKREIITL